jgi:hypothetical protein
MTFNRKRLDPEATKVFTGTEVGTILEQIDDKLGLIIEGQELLRSRVTKIETKVEVVADAVGDVKLEVAGVNDKLDRKADRVVVQSIDRRVATLEAK